MNSDDHGLLQNIVNSRINLIYATREVTGEGGQKLALHSEIDKEEGRFLHAIISADPSICKTLEVGCAYGLSSLHICEALRSRDNPRHTIIDPFQYSQWDGVGVKNLQDSGIAFFNLIEKRSEFVLPELLQVEGSTYDLIFIDGWHTFDHTLLDCFYATRLLRTGGYLVIDDLVLPSVRRAADYLSFYSCYQEYCACKSPLPTSLKRRCARALLSILPASKMGIIHPDFRHRVFNDYHTTMIALRKIAQDERNWDWYVGDF